MHPQHSEAPLAPRRPLILIVEDDRSIAALLEDELTFSGYDVHLVPNGLQAIASVGDHRPDAIVLDLMMPGMHGWDFIERYRDVTGGQTIPIVIVSAAGAIPRSLYANGVRRFISKPFDLDELHDALAEILGTPVRSATQ